MEEVDDIPELVSLDSLRVPLTIITGSLGTLHHYSYLFLSCDYCVDFEFNNYLNMYDSFKNLKNELCDTV